MYIFEKIYLYIYIYKFLNFMYKIGHFKTPSNKVRHADVFVCDVLCTVLFTSSRDTTSNWLNQDTG